MCFYGAVPLDSSHVTVKLGVAKPSAVSVAVNVPVIDVSSSPVFVISPAIVAASFTALTVTVIS